jgi:4-hydroxybenzoate polyprenyltransferase
MNYERFDRIKHPNLWATLSFMVAAAALVTTPTWSPTVIFHLVAFVAGMVAGCGMCEIEFERRER